MAEKLMRTLNKAKKLDQFLDAVDVYKPSLVDGLVLLVRVEHGKAGLPNEMRLEIEPDSAEETAIREMLKGLIDGKVAKVHAELDKLGLARVDGDVVLKAK